MLIQTIQEVRQFLDNIPSFKNTGKEAANFSLERFEKFCNVLENPQNAFPAIHVAGSNGKGSTCQIIGCIYRTAGYKVGIYTSPHIISYSERFMVNDRQISDEELVLFFSSYQSLIKSFRLTYFEISTAIAFWWFARQQVQLGIIEAGLGGRLDATNIITPLVSVITNVSLDHTNILGDTIADIAREKAGIIKKGVPVVMGNMPEEAAHQIGQTAYEKQSRLLTIDELSPHWEEGKYSLQVAGKRMQLPSQLETPVQANNIAAAYRVMQALQSRLPVGENQFIEGIHRVRTLYPNRGRFEKLHPNYDWYFDGAHNLAAVQAMKQAVEIIHPVDDTVLVLSLMNDKINKKMMIEFSEFKKIVYHTLPLGRAATYEDIKKWMPKAQPFPVKQEIASKMLKELSSELVIFAGSFYFYETVRDWLELYITE
jgi:dihydrofolate synthase/folylpolyglutamate synthase